MKQKLSHKMDIVPQLRLLRGLANVLHSISRLVDLIPGNLHHGKLFLQRNRKETLIHLRLNIVVAVHKADVLPPGLVNPQIPCAGDAPVFLVKNLNAPVLQGKFLRHGPAAVRGAVVHQNDFQIFIGLAADGIHAPLQIIQCIINRHDYADQHRPFSLLHNV